MWTDEEKELTITLEPLLGCNTALSPTGLPYGTFRRMKNTWQGRPGAEVKRPGSIPVTNTALTNPIEWLGLFQANRKVMAASNKKLYSFNPSTKIWEEVTGSLNRSDIFEIDYTDKDTNLRKMIADGSSLKEYNDATNLLSAVVPSADAPMPEPPNVLSTLNSKGIRYVWSYAGYLFVAFAKDDIVYYSKWYDYKYFPSTQWERWVRNNDYVNGCGIAFDDNCLIPMRKGWGILLGDNYDAFAGNKFLNTPHGVIAPRSIQRITYPDGLQSIAYLSDDGVHEIYDTGLIGEGSRRFSTRSLTENKLDMNWGLTETEKEGAVGFFDASRSLYLLKFNRGSERIVYAYDTRNREWYPEWTNIRASGFVFTDSLYYAGQTGHLHKFDPLLASDWDDKDKTSGTPIDMDIYTDIIALEGTGYASYLDYLIIAAKQFSTKSSLDVEINFFSGTEEYENFTKNQFMAWGVTEWGVGVWFNVNFTDLIDKPARKVIKKKSPYFQIRFRNNRDELVEIYRITLIGRATGY